MISNKLHAITRFFTFHPLTLLYRSCTFVYLTHSMLFLSLFSSIHILYRSEMNLGCVERYAIIIKSLFLFFFFFFFSIQSKHELIARCVSGWISMGFIIFRKLRFSCRSFGRLVKSDIRWKSANQFTRYAWTIFRLINLFRTLELAVCMN